MLSLPAMFEEYQALIRDPSYCPSDAVETLKAQITAIWMTQDPEESDVAEVFLRHFAAEDGSVLALKERVGEIAEWGTLSVHSQSKDAFGNPIVEYEVTAQTQQGNALSIHRHAHYTVSEERHLLTQETHSLIRIIGDPILHQPGKLFPEEPSSEELETLRQQIEIAKAILIKTGGAGIAANQCAEIEDPYRFAIVGVYHGNQEHEAGVRRRYPTTEFPEAMVMVNPVIRSYSEREQSFAHGCLSVPSPHRCEIKTPATMTVGYLDLDTMFVTVCELEGPDAVVLAHEMAHILDGKTYLEIALASLDSAQLEIFETQIDGELERRREDRFATPDIHVVSPHITIRFNSDNVAYVDQDVLREALPKLTTQTLEGMRMKCRLIHSQQYDEADQDVAEDDDALNPGPK